MNLKDYIESGILELYVLDSLSIDERLGVEIMVKNHKEIAVEISKIEKALVEYATLNAIEPKLEIQHQLIDNIVNLQKEQVMNINDLPLINTYTNYNNWLTFIKDLELASVEEGKSIAVLRDDDVVLQMLIKSATDIEEETHEYERESFLILEGECKCTIAGNVRFMKTGDFMEIPMYKVHDVKLVSASVTAILQRVKL